MGAQDRAAVAGKGSRTYAPVMLAALVDTLVADFLPLILVSVVLVITGLVALVKRLLP